MSTTNKPTTNKQTDGAYCPRRKEEAHRHSEEGKERACRHPDLGKEEDAPPLPAKGTLPLPTGHRHPQRKRHAATSSGENGVSPFSTAWRRASPPTRGQGGDIASRAAQTAERFT
ncbi:hypothetical protein B5F40_06485 [Gordonibacter sp. An230]|nr:hypothetical protein B5F40_06485 [Gordonibacter sp. An230]